MKNIQIKTMLIHQSWGLRNQPELIETCTAVHRISSEAMHIMFCVVCVETVEKYILVQDWSAVLMNHLFLNISQSDVTNSQAAHT